MNQSSTLRGFRIKGRKGLTHWEPLLEEWLLSIERYCRVWRGDDAPYGYTERANIGVLAGAAWRCGRVALEESQYEKGLRNQPKWDGRADLFIASDETEELIEAKFRWVSLSSATTLARVAKATMKLALRDARVTRGVDSDLTSIGVTFLPTWLPKKRGDVLDMKLECAIRELCEGDFHAVAWTFPKERRLVVSDAGNFTPGVFLIASNVRFA
jgi:hypothetical protein